jgi:hypothetical protein
MSLTINVFENWGVFRISSNGLGINSDKLPCAISTSTRRLAWPVDKAAGNVRNGGAKLSPFKLILGETIAYPLNLIAPAKVSRVAVYFSLLFITRKALDVRTKLGGHPQKRLLFMIL